MPSILTTCKGGGGFVRGQFGGEIFAFQFGVEIFPAKLFCTIRGISCSLCILGGGGVSHVRWPCGKIGGVTKLSPHETPLPRRGNVSAPGRAGHLL